MTRSLDIVYFAWVRERLGMDQERVQLDDDTGTTGDVLTMLVDRGGIYAEIFADTGKLRFALDQDYAVLATPVGSAQELAIFPPVTGG